MEKINNLYNILKNVFLFSDFDEREIAKLEEYITLKRFEKGAHIFIEGIIAREFYILISGKVKIYKLSSNGDEHILHIHSSGDLIAEAAIFDLKLYPAYCCALEDTEVICITTDMFRSLIEQNPKLSLKMMAGYSRRLREFVSKISDLSFRNVKSRLAKFILDNTSDQRVCQINITKKELAALLGTIPETLSRTFDYLKKKGLIEEREQLIYIKDKEKLTILAEL